MSLAPGDLGIDRSGALITPAQVKHKHGKFIGRYSSGAASWDAANSWKICAPNEIADAEKLGIDIIAISESTIDRITQGHAAGLADGAADVTFWKSRGLAQGATVFCCWDTFPYPSQYDAVEAYLKGWAEGAAGYYEPGGYMGDLAGREMVRRGALTRYIQPNAGSWSVNDLPYQPADPRSFLDEAIRVSGACMWQTGNYWFGTGADEDMILRAPVGSHLDAKHGLLEEDPLAAYTLEQIADAVWARKYKAADGQEHRMDVHLALARQRANEAADHARTVAKVVATLPARVAATQKALAAIATEVTAVRKAVAAIEPAKQVAVDVAAIAAATSAQVVTQIKSLIWRVGA